MKIFTVVGARPQFVKAAVVSRSIKAEKDVHETMLHTGQHFDSKMSDIFFEEMKISPPKYNLGISGLNHGSMTGEMLKGIEEALMNEKPDLVLVYGDTNSTLAGALAASKLHIKIAHVEAGLRSFNMKMPEEINRILTDRVSNFLFCPTDTAINNLKNEGFDNFKADIIKSGDVMLDAIKFYSQFSSPSPYKNEDFILATIHRAENTDNATNLNNIFSALREISRSTKVILPLHPRTKKILNLNNINTSNLTIIEPVGYFEMISLLKECKLVATDSGGLQKEAYFFKKPCVTLRNETEWIELVNENCNILVGNHTTTILEGYNIIKSKKLDFNNALYGKGDAGDLIIKHLVKNL